MRGNVWKVATIGALVGLWMFGPSEAAAQFAPNARPIFGAARLQAGFMPDPHVMSGTMGGPVQANQINGSCRGHISGPPSHIVRSRSGFRNIRFVVSAQRDSTLVVMLPNGAIVCNDDGGVGMNPLVEIAAGRGRIAIWVGSYSRSNIGTRYSIGITELGHITANNIGGGGGVVVAPRPPVVQPAAGGIQPQMPPSYGTISLRAGFMPDPHVVSGQAGGPIRGNAVNGSCSGHFTPNPNHVLMAPTGFQQIRFVVNSGRLDTTLLVMLPNGRILCNDDGGQGSNPLVVANSGPGPIRVWVGTYSSNRTGPYNIGFSERGHVGTNNVPAPGGVVVAPRPPSVVAVTPADIVQMMVSIPVTLMGPGMSGNTVAMWNPRGGRPTQIRLQGNNLMAGNQRLEAIPSTLRDPVITVVQQRRGALIIRAEQPPMGRGDRGQQFLLRVQWRGRPVVTDRWSGTAAQRGPRWSR